MIWLLQIVTVTESEFCLQVYQRISAYSSRLDNTVELYSTINFPSIPGFPKSEPIITTVNLKHQFEAVGGSTVKIKYEETEVKSSGIPFLLLPPLYPEFIVSSNRKRCFVSHTCTYS